MAGNLARCLHAAFQLRGVAQERPRLGNISDCEVLVDFEDFRKTQATWQPLSDVVEITGLSSKCEREVVNFMPRRSRLHCDVEQLYCEVLGRLEASDTRGIVRMFEAALKHNPREVTNPKPSIRMCEQEQEVLFVRMHPGSRHKASWRSWCPSRPPTKHSVSLLFSSSTYSVSGRLKV